MENTSTTNNIGGKRKNAGRNELPRDEKKQPVTIYVKGATIKELGGMAKTKIAALTAIEAATNKQ